MSFAASSDRRLQLQPSAAVTGRPFGTPAAAVTPETTLTLAQVPATLPRSTRFALHSPPTRQVSVTRGALPLQVALGAARASPAAVAAVACASPSSEDHRRWSESSRLARELDETAIYLFLELERLSSTLPRELAARVDRWCVKLSSVASTSLSLQKDRDTYLRLLLDQVQKRSLAFPFDKAPPDGVLPRLPAYLNLARPLPPRKHAWHEVLQNLGTTFVAASQQRATAPAAGGPQSPTGGYSKESIIGGEKEAQRQLWLNQYHTEHRSPERNVTRHETPGILPTHRPQSLRAQFQNSVLQFANGGYSSATPSTAVAADRTDRDQYSHEHTTDLTPASGRHGGAFATESRRAHPRERGAAWSHDDVDGDESPYESEGDREPSSSHGRLRAPHSFGQHVHPVRDPPLPTVATNAQGLVADVVLANLAAEVHAQRRDRAQRDGVRQTPHAEQLLGAHSHDPRDDDPYDDAYRPFASENASLRRQRDRARAERDIAKQAASELEFALRQALNERDALERELATIRALDDDPARGGGHAFLALSRQHEDQLATAEAAWNAERTRMRAQLEDANRLLALRAGREYDHLVDAQRVAQQAAQEVAAQQRQQEQPDQAQAQAQVQIQPYALAQSAAAFRSGSLSADPVAPRPPSPAEIARAQAQERARLEAQAIVQAHERAEAEAEAAEAQARAQARARAAAKAKAKARAQSEESEAEEREEAEAAELERTSPRELDADVDAVVDPRASPSDTWSIKSVQPSPSPITETRPASSPSSSDDLRADMRAATEQALELEAILARFDVDEKGAEEQEEAHHDDDSSQVHTEDQHQALHTGAVGSNAYDSHEQEELHSHELVAVPSAASAASATASPITPSPASPPPSASPRDRSAPSSARQSKLRQPTLYDTSFLRAASPSEPTTPAFGVFTHIDDHGLTVDVNPTASPVSTRGRSPDGRTATSISPTSSPLSSSRSSRWRPLSPSGYGAHGRNTNPVGENGHRIHTGSASPVRHSPSRARSVSRTRTRDPRSFVQTMPEDDDAFMRYLQHFQTTSRALTASTKRNATPDQALKRANKQASEHYTIESRFDQLEQTEVMHLHTPVPTRH